MRKISFITLAVILCITLSGCEIIAEKPQEKRIFMLSAGLDYKGTGASILKGTVNDQKAMISQMAYLAAKENTSFHSVAVTGGRTAQSEEMSSRQLSLKSLPDLQEEFSLPTYSFSTMQDTALNAAMKERNILTEPSSWIISIPFHQ